MTSDPVDLGQPAPTSASSKPGLVVFVAGLGLVAAVCAVVVGLVVAGGGSDPEDVETAQASTTTSTTLLEPAAVEPEDGTTDTVLEPTSDDAATPSDDEATSSEEAIAGTEAASYLGPSWIVPWREGFLSIAVEFTPPPFPDLSEYEDFFPQEIVDLLADDGPATLDDATAMLDEAGLLDEATEIVEQNPELMELLTSPAPGSSKVIVQESPDGASWTERGDVVFPGGDINSVAADGSHLVVATSMWDEASGRNPQTISTTPDLSSWNSFEVTGPQLGDLPDYVRADTWVQTIAASSTGWVAVLGDSVWLDELALLPEGFAEGLDDPYGSNYDDEGVTIEVYPPFDEALEAEAAVDEPFEEPEPIETYRFTWDELGIDQSLVGTYLYGRGTTRVLSAGWGGSVTEATLDDYWIEVVTPTDAGFVALAVEAITPPIGEPDGAEPFFEEPTQQILFAEADGSFSPAGQLDTSGDRWITAVAPIEGGVLALVGGPDGTTAYRADARAAAWSEVVLPDLPTTDVYPAFPPAGSSPGGFATVLDAAVYPDPFADISEIVVAKDGYELVIDPQGEGELGTLYGPDGVEIGAYGPPYSEDGSPAEDVLLDERTGAVTFLDPETGDELVTITFEDVDAAWTTAMQEAGIDPEEEVPYVPDLWLVATRDGETWLVEDLPDDPEGQAWPSAAGMNGDTVVVTFGAEFRRYTLG